MAGRFLSLEEAARQLGVTVEEVNRLVDRKKLFPMRDGSTVKFKAEDIERAAQDLAADSTPPDDLALDLDVPADAELSLDDLSLGEPISEGESIFAVDQPEPKGSSQTLVRGEGSDAAVSGLPLPAVGGDDVVFDDAAGSGLTLDLGSLGSGGLGSGGRPATGSGAGAALSGVVDSGLSLESDAPVLSDIDLGGSGVAGSRVSATTGGSLAGASGSLAGVSSPSIGGGSDVAGDEFQLGADLATDEGASVVIPIEETGDSSFFPPATEGDGSTMVEDISGDASVILHEPMDAVLEMPFSGLQIAGLVCCSLLLMFGGFVIYDLLRVTGSPDGPTLINPVLDHMAETFGWR